MALVAIPGAINLVQYALHRLYIPERLPSVPEVPACADMSWFELLQGLERGSAGLSVHDYVVHPIVVVSEESILRQPVRGPPLKQVLPSACHGL